MTATLSRRLASEFLGTAFLVTAVVGSGIMGERLAGGNVAIALLANTIATGAALVVLILIFGPISGAHFNPAVTLADAIEGGLRWPGWRALHSRAVRRRCRRNNRCPSHVQAAHHLFLTNMHEAVALNCSANSLPPLACCLSFGAVPAHVQE